LDSVFRELTRGDERLDRGASWQDESEDTEDSNEEKSPEQPAA
jgi:hypothetical protein